MPSRKFYWIHYFVNAVWKTCLDLFLFLLLFDFDKFTYKKVIIWEGETKLSNSWRGENQGSQISWEFIV